MFTQFASGSFLGRILLLALIVVGAFLPFSWAEGKDSSPAGVAEKPISIESPLDLDKVIPVPLEAGAGGRTDILRLAWIVFSIKEDEVHADLRFVMTSWPKGKWKIDIELLESDGKTLRTASAVVENGGVIIGFPVVYEADVRFALDPATGLSQVKRFRVRVGQSAADAIVNSKLVNPGQAKRSQGQFSINVTVRGGNTPPYEHGEFILWQSLDEKKPGGPAAGLSALHGGRGVRWHDSATGETWGPRSSVAYKSPRIKYAFDGLPIGNYRVTAVNSSKGDPTPSTASDSLRLDDENPTGKVTLQFEGAYPLVVTLVSADTGEPLPSTYVVLQREDGMPIVAASGPRGRYTDKSGTKHFSHLQAGLYSLHLGLHNDHRRW